MMEYLVQYDKRLHMYRTTKQERRLEIFKKNQPLLINRLSKIEIASYLNIASGTLSVAFRKI